MFYFKITEKLPYLEYIFQSDEKDFRKQPFVDLILKIK